MHYTCNTCCLQFESGEQQRTHMKCDWHRYNLKRRVAQLQPVSEDTYNAKVKVLAAGDGSGATTAAGKQLSKREQRRRDKEALLEKKRQLLEVARQNMLKSKEIAKQTAAEPSVEQQRDDGEDEENEAEAQQNEAEAHQNEAEAQQNEAEAHQNKAEAHQNKAEAQQNEAEAQQNIIDPDVLAEKLMEEKIANKVDIPSNVCLFCNHSQKMQHVSTFPDMEANLDHMFKSHGFYIPEHKYLVDKAGLVKYMSEKIGLGNVCIVCNYQGRSLEAVRNHMLAKRHCRIPYESVNDKLEISEFYDFTKSYDQFNKDKSVSNSIPNNEDNEDDWEDIGSDEEAQDEGEDDEELPEQEYLYNDGYELHLPTGIKVGHRSLQRYYNQVERPERELTEGQGTLVAAETRSFLTTFDKKQVQVQQRVWQTEVKDKKRQDKRSAKFINNQPHYRDQLLQ